MPDCTHTDGLTLAPKKLCALFLRPRKAIELLPPEAGLEFFDGPDELTLGCDFTLRSSRAGLPQKLVHRVESLEPPLRLVTIQVRGPFRAYRLEQVFVPIETGTRLVETIAFTPPGGVLGLLPTEAQIREEFTALYHLRRLAFAQRGW